MRISVRENGADGVDGKFILLPFFLLERRGKQFRIWNYVTKVFSTVPSSGLNMNGLSRVWLMSHEALLSTGGGILPAQCSRWRFMRGFRRMAASPLLLRKRLRSV
jgi:hypothetical protein